ncbi:MAG: HD domain-containing protein [Bacillota bacterium]
MKTADQALLKMIEYFGADTRRINHALKVYGFAKAIASGGGVVDVKALEIIELSAILHDIGIHEAERKYQSSAGKHQEIEGPAIAAVILGALGVSAETAERVCFLVGHHHTYGKIDGLDFQILVEADFLVNIFEDELAAPQIKAIRDKYFKTSTGEKLLEGMYGCV